MDSFNAYVALAVAALNEVSGSTWIQWMQGSAVIGSVAVTAILTWVVKDLWMRVEWHDFWLGDCTGSETISGRQDLLEERMGRLEMGLSQTRHKVDNHERMLQHMAAMRAAKAAKKAKVA
jgi:hypothetical protein